MGIITKRGSRKYRVFKMTVFRVPMVDFFYNIFLSLLSDEAGSLALTIKLNPTRLL